jgi:hypothetical protein
MNETLLTWENWEILTIHDEDIYVLFWCEEQSQSTNYCMHWAYELSMTKQEVKELGTSILFFASIMIIFIVLVTTLIRWIFYKFFKK